MRLISLPHFGQADLDRIDIRSMWGVPFKIIPALNGALFQFVLITNYFVMVAGRAFPEGQRQTPVALFADHPVVHIAQPIQLAFQTKGGYPANLSALHVIMSRA